jgi:HEAT repeat protein
MAEESAALPPKIGRPAPLGIAALLPVLTNRPGQANLDRAWSALASEPTYAPRLIARIQNTEDSATRAILVLVLGADNGTAETRTELFRILAEDGAPEVRTAAAAATAWSAGDDPRRIPVLHGLQIPVGPIQDPGAVQSILAAAEVERDPAVLASLIRAVGPSEGPDGAISTRLAELAHSESEVVRDAALAALRDSPPADTRLLLRLIEDESLPLPARAELIRGLAGRRSAVTDLSGIIRGAEEVALKVAAVAALSDCWDKYARIEVLETLRSSSVPEVRRAAVGVLSNAPSADTLEVLNRVAAEDDDPGTRQEAGRAAREMARVLKPEPESR